MGLGIKKCLLLVMVLFLFTGCANKTGTIEPKNHVGVTTVVSTAGGVALGGIVGGMLGLLVSGGTGGVAPLVGVALGATAVGSLGYGVGQTIDN
jgi:hypothetical protein